MIVSCPASALACWTAARNVHLPPAVRHMLSAGVMSSASVTSLTTNVAARPRFAAASTHMALMGRHHTILTLAGLLSGDLCGTIAVILSTRLAACVDPRRGLLHLARCAANPGPSGRGREAHERSAAAPCAGKPVPDSAS